VANTSSAKKAVRTIARRTEENRPTRTAVKTAVKKTLQASPEQAPEALKHAMKTLDQAAAKNIIHKNKAARKKSRLAKKINAAAK
jgi:small subunit ribosomal protein S20